MNAQRLLLIGIDPGVCTGVAIWNADERRFERIFSYSIIEAMPAVYSECIVVHNVLVLVEDARKRRVFDQADDRSVRGAAVREGVGSVKRDCAIWEEFLRHHQIAFELRAPARTKLDAAKFNALSGWSGRTNQDERDAAMIVFGINAPMARAMLQSYKQRDEQQRRACSR